MLLNNRSIANYVGFDVIRENVEWCQEFIQPAWHGVDFTTTTSTGWSTTPTPRSPAVAPQTRHGASDGVDFAEWPRELVDLTTPGPSASCWFWIISRRNTPAALYEGFPPAEFRRLSSRLEFHYVPKHASWLNMVKI